MKKPVKIYTLFTSSHKLTKMKRLLNLNGMRFVHLADSDINNVHATVNRELVGVDNWLKTNRLSLNVSRTLIMIISNQKNAFNIQI